MLLANLKALCKQKIEINMGTVALLFKEEIYFKIKCYRWIDNYSSGTSDEKRVGTR